MDWNRFSGHSFALFRHREISLSPKISSQEQADGLFLVDSSFFAVWFHNRGRLLNKKILLNENRIFTT